ncbi:EFR1 family ferrodoxin [Lactonifactor longoviformis]|uniref:EFR1 family ferrodoxin n=1 Tax=Lactonifactor longoviformis TaxID=341220 RepID=UPI0036F32097
MIFYFSATGNSKHAAEVIGTKTGETLKDITECVKENQFAFQVSGEERVGIISPTYCWGLPVIVMEFLEKWKVEAGDNTYFYFVTTYGTTTGQSGKRANEYLESKGHSFAAYYSVKMPDSWTPVFDLSDPEKVRRINEKAEEEIRQAADKISRRAAGNYMRHRIPDFASKIYYKTYDTKRRTANFRVEDSCIGCGLCEKKCPADAITLKEGTPVWTREKCVMCLGCLHRCPRFSIQYGEKSKKHGQYVYPGK